MKSGLNVKLGFVLLVVGLLVSLGAVVAYSKENSDQRVLMVF